MLTVRVVIESFFAIQTEEAFPEKTFQGSASVEVVAVFDEDQAFVFGLFGTFQDDLISVIDRHQDVLVVLQMGLKLLKFHKITATLVYVGQSV